MKTETIVMSESFWANSFLSIARRTGRIVFGGHEFVIVDKRGHDIFECSREAQAAGRKKAIEPGEPADLCRTDFVPIYRRLGRDEFIKFIKDNPEIRTYKQAEQKLKELGK